MQTINQLFDDYAQAQNAVRDLERGGIPSNAISLVASNADQRFRPGDRQPDSVADGASNGATIGAVLGGGTGLAAALGALAIPGLGPLVAAGILATTLTTAVGGAVAGGLVGALVDYGVDEKDAHVYAEGVRRGSTLVSVRVDEGQSDTVHQVMARYGGVDADTRRPHYEQGGWSGYDPKAAPYSRDEVERERTRYRAGSGI